MDVSTDLSPINELVGGALTWVFLHFLVKPKLDQLTVILAEISTASRQLARRVGRLEQWARDRGFVPSEHPVNDDDDSAADHTPILGHRTPGGLVVVLVASVAIASSSGCASSSGELRPGQIAYRVARVMCTALEAVPGVEGETSGGETRSPTDPSGAAELTCSEVARRAGLPLTEVCDGNDENEEEHEREHERGDVDEGVSRGPRGADWTDGDRGRRAREAAELASKSAKAYPAHVYRVEPDTAE